MSRTVLIIHGDQDDVVPLKSVLDWAAPQELPVVVVPGADTSFTAGCIFSNASFWIHAPASKATCCWGLGKRKGGRWGNLKSGEGFLIFWRQHVGGCKSDQPPLRYQKSRR